MADEYTRLEAFLTEYIEENHEFLSWLGTRVEHVGEGTVTMAVPYDEKLTNLRPGSQSTPDIHGGIAATMIDTVGGMALRTAFADPLEGDVATITLNVNYLRPATGDLLATANVVRAGSSVGVSEVVVEGPTPADGPKPVAIGQGAYRLFRAD